MSLMAGFKRVFRLPVRNVEREIDEELTFHIEEKIRELVAAGTDPDSARAQVTRSFGDMSAIRRESKGIQQRIAKRIERRDTIASYLQDAQFALRMLRKHPTFTLVAVLTIGLGLGATTAIFSVVDGVLLKPLPYPDADRLVRVYQQNSPTNRWSLSVADYQAIEAQQTSFDDLAALMPRQVTLTGTGAPEMVAAGFVTTGWFRTWGVFPTEGRDFRPGEDRPGAELTVIVSHAFRERYFGSGDVLGEGLVLNGNRYAVVGVLPRDLGALGPYRAQVWPVLQLRTPNRRGPFGIRGIAKLRADASLEEAAADMARISERIFPEWASGFSDKEARLTPYLLKEVMIGGVDRPLKLLLGAVAFVLLIAVANVANLLLARGSTRAREFALRTSLGASRHRLARQLLVESMVLAALGGIVGVLIAFAALEALVAIGPQIPRLADVALDRRVLGFAAIATLISGVLFGLAPLVSTLSDLAASMRAAGSRSTSAGSGMRTIRGALVTAEFALALPLLAGAALLFTSLQRLQRVDVGFDSADLLLSSVSLPTSSYPNFRAISQFWDEALTNVRAIPGVVDAAVTSALPPDDPRNTNNFDLVDKPVPEGTPEHIAPWLSVTPTYFETMGIGLVQGRLLDATDVLDAPPVIVVSRSWAARYYPDEEAIGKRVYEGGDRSQSWTVVGVVDDVKYTGLASDSDDAVYALLAQYPWRAVNLVVRAGGGSVTMEEVRRQLRRMDPDLALANSQTMQAKLDASIDQPRYWTMLVGAFAVVGIVLVAVGIYGVLSYFVTSQSRDIGIRMALGADTNSVRGMIVRRGMLQAGIGLAVGLGGSLVLIRSLEGMLFDVSPTDPATFLVVSVILLSVALGACYLPAHRATRVDPVQVLADE